MYWSIDNFESISLIFLKMFVLSFLFPDMSISLSHHGHTTTSTHFICLPNVSTFVTVKGFGVAKWLDS
jgi:hypothetical protein